MTTFSSRSLRAAAFLLFVVPLGACSSRPAPENFSAHMLTHYSRISALQSAVIVADMATAQRSGRWLGEYVSAEGLTPRAVHYMMEIRRVSTEIGRADDLVDLAAHTATLASACAGCHEETGGGPRLGGTPHVPHEEGRVPHMRRHLWAVDRMWEGLLAPSDQFWQAGARALAEPPLTGWLHSSGMDEVTPLAERVHELGAQAAQISDPSARAQLYGELIGTCATCHQALGVPGD